MHDDLERLIAERFVLMRRELHLDTDFGYWGYAVPNGWFSLLVQFAKTLEEIEPQDLVIYQIKEKLNRLVVCCECTGQDETIAALDDLEVVVERESQLICGRCGERLGDDHECHPRSENHEEMVAWATDCIAKSRRISVT